MSSRDCRTTRHSFMVGVPPSADHGLMGFGAASITVASPLDTQTDAEVSSPETDVRCRLEHMERLRRTLEREHAVAAARGQAPSIQTIHGTLSGGGVRTLTVTDRVSRAIALVRQQRRLKERIMCLSPSAQWSGGSETVRSRSEPGQHRRAEMVESGGSSSGRVGGPRVDLEWGANTAVVRGGRPTGLGSGTCCTMVGTGADSGRRSGGGREDVMNDDLPTHCYSFGRIGSSVATNDGDLQQVEQETVSSQNLAYDIENLSKTRSDVTLLEELVRQHTTLVTCARGRRMASIRSMRRRN